MKITSFQEINWKKMYEVVTNLQDQLVRATKDNDKLKIYRLQMQIVRSYAGRCIAVRKTVTSSGSKTPGVDNILLKSGEDKLKVIKEMRNHVMTPDSYKSKPIKRILIDKPSGGKRSLGIPTMMDRCMQNLFLLAIDPVVETTSDLRSYGFRKNRSAHDAIEALSHRFLKERNYSRYIFETDIKNCFDDIRHESIMDKLILFDKSFIRKWLQCDIQIERKKLKTSNRGIPQGGVISPVLCNLVLNGLEKAVYDYRNQYKLADRGKLRIEYNRYADDLVVTGSNVIHLNQIKTILEKYLEKCGLTLKEEKTRIIDMEKDLKGFNYLGFNFRLTRLVSKRNKVRMANGTVKTWKQVLIVKPTSKNIKSIKYKIKQVIKTYKAPELIIKELNPILRGFSEYYKKSYHSIKVFEHLGCYIYQKLWKYLRKRYMFEKAKKLKNKYFWPANNRVWNFGLNEKYLLFNISAVKWKKHIKITLRKNPYLLEDLEYFLKRGNNIADSNFRGAIYKKYEYKCGGCEQSLFNGEDVELHHITPERLGGKWTMKNIMPLHKLCHIQVTKNFNKIKLSTEANSL